MIYPLTIMEYFKSNLLKTTKYMGVTIDFHSSTEGYFIQTSQGLVSDYMKTKKEAIEYIRTVKNNIKTEIN
jgi:hypothetical protein